MSQDNLDQLLSKAQSPQIDGIIVIDHKGTIVALDQDAEHLLGYQASELIGQPVTQLMPESYRAEHPQHLQSALHRPGKVSKLHLQRTIVACHKNGDMIPLAITVSADTSSGELRLTGILQDLRKHEQQLNQLHQNILQTTSLLNRRIQFDDLLNKYANLLLSCSAEDLKQQINAALLDIALFLNIDHIYLISFNEQLAEASLWTSWRRSVSLVKPFPDQFTIPAHIPLVDLLHKKQELIIDESEQSNGDLFQLLQALSPNGFRSSWLKSVFSPEGDISGCVGFTFLDDNHKPDKTTQPLLSLALRLLASALARHQLIERMIENERQISLKGRLVAEKAALAHQLQKYTNRLYQAEFSEFSHEIDNTLLESALMAGQQNCWIALTPEFYASGHLLALKKPTSNLPSRHGNIATWAFEKIRHQKVFQLDDSDLIKACLRADKDAQHWPAELTENGIRNLTLVTIGNGARPLGFLLYYNSAPQYITTPDVIDFLRSIGQVLATTLQHHETQLELKNARRGLEDANRILSRQALHDPLTGLANRRAFDQTIRTEFDRAKRHRSSLCLILADIDFFKRYNDHYGHPQGDVCLQQVARVMQQTFHRAGEACCRYGGEEFAIILPAINQQEAQRQGERLLANLKAANIAHSPQSPTPFVSMSLGLALFSADTTFEQAEILIEAADQALYQAKAQGRNRLAWALNHG